MTENTYLNYQFQPATEKADAQTMVFLHGLFGDMNNLGIIARQFSEQFNILRVDLRNHGQSFHSDEMNYHLMAQDLQALLQHLHLTDNIVIGHSMGGKTAMTLANIAPDLIEKLVVIDIAPAANPPHRHNNNFAGLFAVKAARPATRQQAKTVLAQYVKDEGEQQFMLKAFDPQKPDYFRFNLTSIKANYENLMGWNEVFFDKPTLFIKGGASDYIQAKDTDTILKQFPQAKSFVVANAQHWVHAEKPETVARAIQKFLDKE
ncbi:alpha/beta fold hydrolase [Actinobacillus pleuropneumoniae]|uniref:Putative esterase/lipase n=1 Tax=Actinobacillus pleuropneumoniae serotype 3 (strain JL03) TaxID=434271 RepID=B0BP32_ACTPJ|nr:alpha/beta fold hydrolase [Actinobacillus pleuropneumoniae]ABY69317.1 putative esterase/lipase [Actinobacillus pleuropneumoniae serovar 3 str. JL03]KIE91149.1 putative esterase/lipase [Actinobacillus pleuropneumoniae]KIE91606.1 putative esterase/lipase [Actinobacillus pleuropneumoniae]KIE91887.1 putative esterase/lipase [Actinobacillus pleuropneumoniae]KIE97023.1 putative esterase/lipase [Actinobacillus pleuropneumoniae]